MNDNRPYGPPMNTDIGYYQTIFVSCVMLIMHFPGEVLHGYL